MATLLAAVLAIALLTVSAASSDQVIKRTLRIATIAVLIMGMAVQTAVLALGAPPAPGVTPPATEVGARS